MVRIERCLGLLKEMGSILEQMLRDSVQVLSEPGLLEKISLAESRVDGLEHRLVQEVRTLLPQKPAGEFDQILACLHLGEDLEDISDTCQEISWYSLQLKVSSKMLLLLRNIVAVLSSMVDVRIKSVLSSETWVAGAFVEMTNTLEENLQNYRDAFVECFEAGLLSKGNYLVLDEVFSKLRKMGDRLKARSDGLWKTDSVSAVLKEHQT